VTALDELVERSDKEPQLAKEGMLGRFAWPALFSHPDARTAV
jgi:hypothetical protein